MAVAAAATAMLVFSLQSLRMALFCYVKVNLTLFVRFRTDLTQSVKRQS